ncbi:transcription elongation factor TFIIS [Rhizina undulata]
MDVKEVKVHVSNLEKAVKEKHPPASVIDILSALKQHVVATESLLRETKVGMAVNKLRMNADKSVSDLAKEIVNKWKKDVHQKTRPSGGHDSKAKERTATASPSRTPPKPSGKRPDSRQKVDPSQRSQKTDGVNCQITGEKVRDNCIGMVYDGLCIDSETDPSQILNLAKSIELSVFVNHHKKVDMAYKRRMQVIFLNLKDKKNPALRRRVMNGEISAERMATITTQEMASEERKLMDEKLQKDNMNKAMAAKAEKSISDQLTCGKCGKKKVSYSQAQTRSADEPMTTFCECEICGHRWKFS